MLTHTLNLFLPTSQNGYRAHLTKPATIILAIAVFVSVSVGYLIIKKSSHQVLGSSDDLTEATIISLTNLERTKAGLAPLEPSPELNTAAYNKALDMIQNQYWNHVSQTDKQPWEFIDEAGYNYLSAGENLARNYPSAEAVITGWLNSPAHKDNLLSQNYTHTGVAVVKGELLENPQAVLIVQMFASPLPPGAVRVDQNTYRLAPLISKEATFLDRLADFIPPIIKIALTIFLGSYLVAMAIDVKWGKKKRQKTPNLPLRLWHS